MTIKEYTKIKKLNYKEYCNYLQEKYGNATCNYMTQSYNKIQKVSRTSEGLYCHHIKEDTAILLSTKEYAQNHPIEWQYAENLVYCDLLEHMLLHILICEENKKELNEKLKFLDKHPEFRKHFKIEIVGIGGILNFFIPELNDFYSGWESRQTWQQTCHNRIRDDKKTYFELIKRVKKLKGYPLYDESGLYNSFGFLANWDKSKNEPLYEELRNL